jgi:hypothetical protein
MKATIEGVAPEKTRQVRFVEVSQLPTYPVAPPPGAEALGLIAWDLPQVVRYTPGTEMRANVEVSNPSAEERLYVVSYYFLNPQGVVAQEGFITFMTDSLEFTAFYLPPQSPKPAFFQVTFSINDLDYAFGLRLLLCEMTDSSARVIQETSRVQVLLASEATYNRLQTPSALIAGIAGLMVAGMLAIVIKQV